VREAALEECRNQGGYFLNDDEARRLAELIFPGGSHAPSPKVVGRPATHVAELAGLKVPTETRVLIARLNEVGRQAPLSGEKLCPVLGFYSVPNLAAGIDLCTQLLRFGGMGHTASIHSQDATAVREFGVAVPAFRVCVNTASTHGSVGYSTNLFPAMTLGCGALGGNITSDNIGPQHLMNLRRVAWESRAVEHRTISAANRMSTPESAGSSAAKQIVAPSSPTSVAGKPLHAASQMQITATKSGAPDRSAIAHAVEHVMAHLGIARGAAASSAAKGAMSAPTTPKPVVAPGSVSAFVTEGDVRRAVTRGEKIFIGPKTILTPSARDVAGSEGVLVITDFVPPGPAATSSE
jgi:acetaldehyde dehydrogenase (acetylating)